MPPSCNSNWNPCAVAVANPSKDHVKAKLREHVQGCAGCDVCQKWRHKFLKRSNKTTKVHKKKVETAADASTNAAEVPAKKRKKDAAVGSMAGLMIVTPVSAELSKQAEQWSLWNSEAFTFDEPQSAHKFQADYSDVHEHRVVVLKGKASLTPDDGSEALTICSGDSVVMKRGLRVTWHILEPMTKYFGYFDESGNQVRTSTVGCDECGADCWEVSWFIEELDMDICPKCRKTALKAGQGDGEDMYAGAVMQRRGKDVKKKKKKRPEEKRKKSEKKPKEDDDDEEEPKDDDDDEEPKDDDDEEEPKDDDDEEDSC